MVDIPKFVVLHAVGGRLFRAEHLALQVSSGVRDAVVEAPPPLVLLATITAEALSREQQQQQQQRQQQ